MASLPPEGLMVFPHFPCSREEKWIRRHLGALLHSGSNKATTNCPAVDCTTAGPSACGSPRRRRQAKLVTLSFVDLHDCEERPRSPWDEVCFKAMAPPWKDLAAAH